MSVNMSIGRGIRLMWLTLADESSLVRSGLLLRALSRFSFSSISFSSCNFFAWAAARSARIRSSSACSSFSSSSSSSLSSSSLSESSSLRGKRNRVGEVQVENATSMGRTWKNQNHLNHQPPHPCRHTAATSPHLVLVDSSTKEAHRL